MTMIIICTIATIALVVMCGVLLIQERQINKCTMEELELVKKWCKQQLEADDEDHA